MDYSARSASSRLGRLLAAAVVSAAVTATVAAQNGQKPPASNGAAPAKKEINTEGLPTFLLTVPGGQVTIGLTIEQMLDAVRQVISPTKPALADKEVKKVETGLKQNASQLGADRRTVDTFLLSKWAVTNREYEVFVKRMLAQGAKVKPPYHWWRYGRKDDYEKRLEEINRMFPKERSFAPIYYWEAKGHELPYALLDDKGNKIDDLPLAFVSKVDAVRFAGYLGMRLPTEVEWMRAARGDGNTIWPWGNNKDLGDCYSEKVLDLMQLSKMSDRKLKPVGAVQFCNGPFGHFDMFGQVAEYVADVTFAPIGGQKAFEDEWKRAQKDKLGALIVMPSWKDGRAIVKGGSFMAAGQPSQLMLDWRDSLQTNEALDAVGFRLAKSPRPGYDLLVSIVSSDYNQDLFQGGANGQKVDFSAQIGIERYVLDSVGFPQEYHAGTIAPVDWLTADKTMTEPKLEERSQQVPLLLGTLVCTEPMLEPKLPPGAYSVAYRKGGTPKELKDAWSAGHKEVQAALRAKNGKGEEPEAQEKDPKKADWRTVLARFGLNDKDLEPKDAKEPKIVRFGAFEVPIDDSVYLFQDNDGKFIGSSKASGLTAATAGPAEIAVGVHKADKQEHAMMSFKVRVPILKGQAKAVEYKLDVVLEQPPLPADQKWRHP